MALARQYVMTAVESDAQALRGALEALAARIAAVEGCRGTDLFQDAERPGRFLLLEHWASEAAQKSAGKILGKEAFAPVTRLLATPPETAWLEQLSR